MSQKSTERNWHVWSQLLCGTLVSFKLVLKIKVIHPGNGDFITLLFFVFIYKLGVLWGGVLQTTFPYAPPHFPSLSLISSASYDIPRLTICIIFLAWLKLKNREVNVFVLLNMFLEVPD